jgi:hypothetical protein
VLKVTSKESVGFKLEAKNLSEQNKLIFLAGVFEGEGNFGLHKSGQLKSKEFVMQVEMRDQDVVMMFQEYFRVGSVSFQAKRQDHWSDTYKWRAKGVKAFQVLEKIVPYLCKRRKEQFNNIVKELES